MCLHTKGRDPLEDPGPTSTPYGRPRLRTGAHARKGPVWEGDRCVHSIAVRPAPRVNHDAEVRLAYLILIATVPAALIGFLFEDFFATQVRSPWVVVFNLVFVGLLFQIGRAHV